MDPKDLVKVWDAPDHSRLTPKQISIRLPILVAAKVSALCDLYPRSSKSKIIGDLLATALDQVEESLASKKGRVLYVNPETGEPHITETSPEYLEEDGWEMVYEDIGMRGKFRMLTEKYLRALEKEAGIKEPMKIFRAVVHKDEEK
jgi:hypothetical protein